MEITKEETLQVMLEGAAMAADERDSTRIALLLTGILAGLTYLVQEK